MSLFLDGRGEERVKPSASKLGEYSKMRVNFIDPEGQTHSVTGEPGESAMRCATNHLVPGIVGECGGAMACATCHEQRRGFTDGNATHPGARDDPGRRNVPKGVQKFLRIVFHRPHTDALKHAGEGARHGAAA